MISFYIEASYFLSSIALLCAGMMQGIQLVVADPQFLSFRKSSLLRIASGMMSFLFLGGLWVIIQATRPSDYVYLGWFIGPASIGVSCLFAYFAGPQDVRIDLQSRVCLQTKGWFFRPREQTYQLTEASSLCACCGGQACYTMLRVGDSANHRLLLAMCNSQDEAYSFALTIAEKLDLPAKKTTWDEMCKRF